MSWMKNSNAWQSKNSDIKCCVLEVIEVIEDCKFAKYS